MLEAGYSAATASAAGRVGAAQHLAQHLVAGADGGQLPAADHRSAPAEASPLVESLGKRQADLSGLRKRVGCRACRNTGYLGRTTISELLVMSEAVRSGPPPSGTPPGRELTHFPTWWRWPSRTAIAKALRRLSSSFACAIEPQSGDRA
jgi:hypothetical protein